MLSKADNSCGLTVECTPDWNARQVEASVALWDPSNESHVAALRQRHEVMARACSLSRSSSGRVPLTNGAWCISTPATRRGYTTGGPVHLTHNQSYNLPTGYVAADGVVVGTLAALLRGRIPWLTTSHTGRPPSLNDFGAGMGAYGRALRSLVRPSDDVPFEYRGYDGAGNVEERVASTGPPGSGTLVRFFDLTLPLSLPRADWVLSIEVGEHVPPQAEWMFFRNLHAHNCRGVILSWAQPGQGGRGHVNCHSSAYLQRRFDEIGYDVDANLTQYLRRHGPPHCGKECKTGPAHSYLRNSLLALVRRRPLC